MWQAADKSQTPALLKNNQEITPIVQRYNAFKGTSKNHQYT
jgi:hypothetical protein